MNRQRTWLVTVCILGVLLASGSVRAGDGQADLDKALSLKIKATTLDELSKVATLCESAIKKGLDAENQRFANQLLTGALYQRATQLCRPIFGANQPDPRWRMLRSLALPDLEKIVQRDNQFVEAQLLIAHLQLLPDGDREKAKAAIQRAIGLLEKTNNKVQLSETLLLRGRLRTADDQRLADFNRAVELDPKNVGALEARALLYRRRGQFDKAMKDFNGLLESDEKNVPARLAVAEALVNLKRYDDALKHLNKLIEVDSRPAAYALRAELYARQGKNDEAIADLDKVLKETPLDLAARLLRARLYYVQDRNALAAEDLRVVLKARPGVTQAMALSALVSANQGDLRKAIDLMKTLVEKEPDQTAWQLQLATLYHAAEQSPEAIATFSKILEKIPNQWEARRGRADAYLNIGQHAKAVQDYEIALKARPDHGGVLNNYAWVLATSPDKKVRDGKHALELAKRACETTQYKQAYIVSTLAAAYAETGDFDSAVKWSRKAVELGDDAVQEQLKKELESYQKRQPWREKKQLDQDQDKDQDKTKVEDRIKDNGKSKDKKNSKENNAEKDSKKTAGANQ